MKLIAPDYYPSFHCIADKCHHSCCVGWEIDIDPDMRKMYRSIPGEFGRRLNAAIEDGEVATFRLDPDERCPMLSASGLCDLITTLGEDALCQICADHPRFRNYWGRFEVEPCSTSDSDCLQSPSVTISRPCAERWSRIEIGLGLCCEEAARLILSRKEPMQLIPLEDDGELDDLPEEEAALLAFRDTLICVMQEDTRPLAQRLDEVLLLGGLPIPDLDWQAVYRGLERLDPAWDAMLDTLPPTLPDTAPAHLSERIFANFAVYLLYRHLPGALEDDDIPGRAAFCVLSTRVLMALCAAREASLPDCIDLARMYSAEVEYSEDNIAALLDVLYESSIDG